MVVSGSFVLGWEHAAASLLLCLLYVLLYPQFRETTFRLWIAGWWLHAFSIFVGMEPARLAHNSSIFLAVAASGLVLGSILHWIGNGPRVLYFWPAATAALAGIGLSLVIAPASSLTEWTARFLDAGLCIAAGWLLWRAVHHTRYHAARLLSAALFLRGLHLLDRASWAGYPQESARMLFDVVLSLCAGVSMVVVVLSESHRRTEDLARALRRLTDLSAESSRALDEEGLFTSVLGIVLAELRVTAGWIGMAEREVAEPGLVFRVSLGFSEAFRREPPVIDLAEPWLQAAFGADASVFSARECDSAALRHLLRSEHHDALLCAPLYSSGGATLAADSASPAGLLAVAASSPRRFSPGDQQFLSNAAQLLSSHWQRVRLLQRTERTARQWAATLDEINDPVFLHDDKFRIVQANRSAARRLGLAPPDMLGRSLREILRPGGVRWNHCPYCEEVGGRPDERDPNFGGFLVSTVATLEGDDGRPVTLHLLRDVTARRRAEEKLRNLFENMQEGAFMSTPGGRFLDFNEAFQKMLGYETREELLCLDIEKNLFVNPADRERLMKLLREHGAASGFEFQLRRRDGGIVNVLESSVAVRDASGDMVAVQGFLLDITERKQAELEVRRRNRELLLLNSIGQTLSQPLELDELLSRALRQITDLFDLDVAAVFLAEESRGYLERRAAVGLRSSALNWISRRAIPDELVQQVRRTHATVLPPQALASAVPFSELTEEEGLQVWRMIVLWWKERFVGGLLVGSRTRNEIAPAELNLLVAVGNQVAARAESTALYEATRQALENLRRAQEQLVQSEKMVAIGQLISGVAHELNNPLTAILGYSQLLGSATGASPQVADFGAKIAKQAQRTQKIVHNLLSFARQQKPERRSVSINEVLDDTIGLRDYDWRRHRIVVSRELDPDLPDTRGDRHQLQQVFLNILNNAFDVLRDHPEPRGIWVVTARSEGRILIEITDSGPGVREPMRVFDPFYTTKPVGEGTGLGLSICYGIVKEHGGEISVRNSPPRGACFTILLPVIHPLPERVDSPALPAALAAPAVPGFSVLLVDDEEAVLEVEREILRERGHTVHTALSITEALALLESVDLDVVVADFKLPGMLGGQDLLAWLRHHRPALAERVVFTFADGQSEAVREFLVEAGCAALHKPFRVDEFLAVVQQAHSRRGETALPA